MSVGESQKMVRADLPCADPAEFMAKLARVIGTKGVFVPSSAPSDIGTRMLVQLKLRDGSAVSGEATVARHASPGKPPGMLLKFVRLDPTSVQFPFDTSAAAPAAAPVPTSGPAAGPAPGAAPGPARRPPPPLPRAARHEEPPKPAEPAGLAPELDEEEATVVWNKAADAVLQEKPAQAALATGGPSPESPPTPAEPSDETPPLPTELPEGAAPPVPVAAPDDVTAHFNETVARVATHEIKESSKPTSSEDTGLEPFDVLGNYQLLRPLGGGGMAEVYLARATLGEGIEKLVALKTVRPQFGPDTPLGLLFLNEARISVTLQHPNIVQTFDFGEARGRPYLAMEYVHGRSLADVLVWLLDNDKRPHTSLAVAVGIEVCKALEYLHGKHDLDGKPLELVHRDVTPTNILVASSGEVKLLDLGVAAATTDEASRELIVGKAVYMAPEQAVGGTPIPNWDVFALGVVLHQMLTFEQSSDATTAANGAPSPARRALPPPSAANALVPAVLDRAILSATELEPSRRLSSARELRQMLEEALAQLPPVDLPTEIQRMFGTEFASEDTERQRLLAQARQRAPRGRGTNVFSRTLRLAKRRVLTSPLGTRLARYPRLLAGVAAGVALVFLGFTGWGLVSWRTEASYAREVALADERTAVGLWAGSGGDTAVDHLAAARAVKPRDARAVVRLNLIASRLEDLGDAALRRGDEAEAAVHFQAALLAEPARSSATEKLKRAEDAVRTKSARRMRRTQ